MRHMPALGAFLALGLAGCSPDYQPEVPKSGSQPAATADGKPVKLETAVFAGGCFWCTESDFEKVPGVKSAISGFTGGKLDSPTYKAVSAGGTGHYESVEVRYDPRQVSYEQLVHYYFRTVDPTDVGGQFCDRGDSYKTAIFVADPTQRAVAEKEKQAAGTLLHQPIATAIVPASKFWPAEEYHQDYYKKNDLKYHFYRSRCGRDSRLEKVWGKVPKG